MAAQRTPQLFDTILQSQVHCILRPNICTDCLEHRTLRNFYQIPKSCPESSQFVSRMLTPLLELHLVGEAHVWQVECR